MSGQRVLMVGAGVMGHRHAAAIAAAGDLVAGVVDPDPARAAELAPSAAHYTDVEQALTSGDTYDVAVVATPSPAHLDQVTRLVGRGYQVLVEKPHRVPGQDPGPLADTLNGGSGPGATGRVFVGMSTRHWPGVAEAVRAVRAGELGTLLSYDDRLAYRLDPETLPDWYFDPARSGGGVLLTNGVHALDRARAVLGHDLEPLDARLDRVFQSHACEDVAVLACTAGGVPVRVWLGWLPYEPPGTGLTVSGTHGVVEVAMDGAWRVTTTEGTRSGPAIDVQEAPFRAQWAAFTEHAPGFGLDDLEPTLRLIERIYQEARHG